MTTQPTPALRANATADAACCASVLQVAEAREPEAAPVETRQIAACMNDDGGGAGGAAWMTEDGAGGEVNR